jgi:ABC-type cobalamin/Fe3+-siderophores transport system ATPase subunit
MEFPNVAWKQLPSLMQWSQGEHATLIAPTGQGKTTLVRKLLPLTPAIRNYVMVLATKKRDKVLSQFSDYRRMDFPQRWAERVIIYPPFPKNANAMLKAQRETFQRALNEAYQNGGWTVYADEVRYLASDLKLGPELQRLWMQGRSLGVSLIASTQRPRHIPLEAYDQPTHLFFWRDTDRNNVDRIADISGTVDRKSIIERVPQLPQYQFIYANTRTGEIVESKVTL